MDTTVGLLIVTVLIAAAFFFGLRWITRARAKYGGSRVITCPETSHPVSVEVDALQAAFTSAIGLPDIRLQNCSRWPLKKDCGQECLLHLDVAPAECLIHGVLMKWYRGKKCVNCETTFGELHLTDHKPALRSPDGKLLEWNQVSSSEINRVLATHVPVCWNCYTAQSFIVEHPELVVHRPWRGKVAAGPIKIEEASKARFF
jgi:hypothetical protein